MLWLAFGLLWALSASFSDAYTPAPNALAPAKTVVPCKPNSGQPDSQALGNWPFLEPEDGRFIPVEFDKPLKFSLLAVRPPEIISPGIEIHSPKLTTPVVNPFSYLSTPVLVL